MDTEKKNEDAINLRVVESKISGIDSGIARVNESYMKDLDKDEKNLVMVKSGEKEISVRLVSDSRAPKGSVVLRRADMDDLLVAEGDPVDLLPYSTLKEEMKDMWEKLKARFRKEEEEEEKEEA
ncbi:MAG: hypothetical protein ACMUHB_03300 [Thermoplasmatota archaeon]